MDLLELLPFKLGLRSFSASPPLSAEMWAAHTVRSGVGSSRCGMGPGLPAPGGPSAELSSSEPANQDLSPGKPSPCQGHAAAQLWSQARAEQVGASTLSWADSPLGFLPRWEERNQVDPPPLIFFACKTGSLDAGNMGQELQDCLDFRSPDRPGRMWLSLGEIITLPCPALPQPQATCLMTSLGKALSLQHLLAAV